MIIKNDFLILTLSTQYINKKFIFPNGIIWLKKIDIFKS
jgi:hypothetical protein